MCASTWKNKLRCHAILKFYTQFICVKNAGFFVCFGGIDQYSQNERSFCERGNVGKRGWKLWIMWKSLCITYFAPFSKGANVDKIRVKCGYPQSLTGRGMWKCGNFVHYFFAAKLSVV